MTIKQFIEKAIEGGWKPQKLGFTRKPTDFEGFFLNGSKLEITAREQVGTGRDGEKKEGSFWIHMREVITYPEVWQAVGKVEGWQTIGESEKGYHIHPASRAEWEYQMHRMIDALADGKTIEEFIKTL